MPRSSTAEPVVKCGQRAGLSIAGQKARSACAAKLQAQQSWVLTDGFFLYLSTCKTASLQEMPGEPRCPETKKCCQVEDDNLLCMPSKLADSRVGTLAQFRVSLQRHSPLERAQANSLRMQIPFLKWKAMLQTEESSPEHHPRLPAIFPSSQRHGVNQPKAENNSSSSHHISNTLTPSHHT